jgi:hypothetical protein
MFGYSTKFTLVGALFFCLQIIMGIDAASNFIFQFPPKIIPILREVIVLVMFSILLPKIMQLGNIKYFIIIVALLLPAVGLVYGVKYVFYVVRFFIVFFIINAMYSNFGSRIRISFVIIMFFLLAIHSIFSTSLHINQGSRFFAANASVVSLVALALTLSSSRRLSAMGAFFGVSSGSISYYIFFMLRSLASPFFLLIFMISLILIFMSFEQSDSFRRIYILIESLWKNGLIELLSATTVGIRVDQFLTIVNHYKFSTLYGAPNSISPSDAGIESQLLHIIAYGGAYGITTFMIIAAVFSFAFLKLSRRVITFLVIFILYSLTFRWLESFLSVYCIAFIILELGLRKRSLGFVAQIR